MKLKRPKFRNLEPGEFPTAADGFNVVELKYDGWWGQLLIEGNNWKLYSRTGELKREGTFEGSPVPRSLLHGEFVFGTQWAKQRPEYGKLILYGAEEINGFDLRRASNEQVRSVMRDWLPSWRAMGILGSDSSLQLIKQYPIEQAPEMWRKYAEFEGLVFKHTDSVWGSAWARMKRNVEADYVCMGFENSTSDSFKGWGVKCIIGGLYNKNGDLVEVCRIGGGMDNDQRARFYANPHLYVKRVFTAEGKQLMKSGALRHPSFSRWRDDKKAEDCKL